jgi:hypothetical protein
MSDDGPMPAATSPAGKRAAYMVERDLERIRRSFARYGGYFLTIHGTWHMNFADSPLFTPVKQLVAAGPIEPRRAMKIINDHTLAFFERYLNNAPEPLLQISFRPYPEVDLEISPEPEGKINPR